MKTVIKLLVILIGLLLAYLSFRYWSSQPIEPYRQSTPDKEKLSLTGMSFTVMSFNVENLFDNRDDSKKDDKAYLSYSQKQSIEHKKSCARIFVQKWRDECLNMDWSDQVLYQKLNHVAQVIKMADADIVILQEVENSSILSKLNRQHLSKSYREEILLEGWDQRGIDVAILSRLAALGEARLHRIPFFQDGEAKNKNTRGILEGRFKIGPYQIIVLALHLPAPYNSSDLRQSALFFLDQLAKKYKDQGVIIAGGDFNISSKEEKRLGLFSARKSVWQIAHFMPCKETLDEKECRGSSFYATDNSWSFLDSIMLYRGFSLTKNANEQLRSVEINPDSVRIINSLENQVFGQQNIPKHYNAKSQVGVSDHWPILVEIWLP